MVGALARRLFPVSNTLFGGFRSHSFSHIGVVFGFEGSHETKSMKKAFFLSLGVTLVLFLAYTWLYSYKTIAIILTIFFIFSTLFHLWAVEKAQTSSDSKGFFRWIYGSIAVKMLTVVGLAYYLNFVLKVDNSLIMLLIANYMILSIVHIVSLKKYSL